MAIRRKPFIRSDNDGVVSLYVWSSSRDVAGVDWTTVEGLSSADGSVPYASMSIRAQDLELASASGYNVSKKVRAKLSGAMRQALDSQTHKVWAKENTVLYRVTNADMDKTHVFLYLDEVASIGTCELISQTVAKDENLVEHLTDVSLTVQVRQSSLAADNASLEGTQGGLTETEAITVRAVDYSKQPIVKWRGIRWNVTSAATQGEWTTLNLARTARSQQ